MDPEKPTPNAQDARRPNRPYIARTEPLPETEGPSSEHKPRFFKTKQRAYGNMFQVQLGMRVVKFSQFQQDFILNMANQLMVEVEFLNVFVQEPNILYISMNISESEGESASYLETENDVFYLLEECRRLFEEYIGAWLSQDAIFVQDNNSQILMQKFQQTVVERILRIYEDLFNSH